LPDDAGSKRGMIEYVRVAGLVLLFLVALWIFGFVHPH
jgi:hypothetical protein